ncbi:MAG TPA: hypothetical protein VFJ16_25110 [Longimicrobium sp.]|nr:hypothetical protein [Longimicrobium sp.]
MTRDRGRVNAQSVAESGMTLRPIHTDSDYSAALVEVDGLMEAVPGTPEGDRFDILVTLIEAYEARHWSIGTPDPIDMTS